MTPEHAARILGVATSAPREQVEAAYARVARETHPDRFAGGAPEVIATASASFVEAGHARDTLVAARQREAAEQREAAKRTEPAPVFDEFGRRIFVPPFETPKVERGPWPMRIWIALLVFMSLFAGVSGAIAPPWSFLVLVPLDIAALRYAATGGVLWLRTTIALAALFAVLTAVFGTYIPLAILGGLLACVVAVIVLRRE